MSLQANSSGELCISGELTFESVANVYAQSQSTLSGYTGDIDLSGLGAIDSAGLALLLEWQALAHARGSELSFINAPSGLKRLAVLSDAVELLGLTGTGQIGGDE
jgi:phospholipid transport system transporter-binding protein